MPGKPKSQSEADGSDWVQVSGSPHVPQPSDQNPLTEARAGRRDLGWNCPQCGNKMAEHQWGLRCEKPGCHTVIGDPWSGRPGPDTIAPVYACTNCGASTEHRYFAGGGYVALCDRCELARVIHQAERVIANPQVLESVKEGSRRFLADSQVLTFTQVQISPQEVT